MRLSFKLKTILGIALIEAVLLSILVFSGLHYINSSAQEEFTQRASTMINAFTATIKNAVIANDLASLESFINETQNYPGVLYARILDVEGRLLASVGDARLLEGDFKIDETFASIDDGIMDTRGEVEEQGEIFGFIELGISVEGLQSIIRNSKRYGGGLALLEMFLVALFSLMLGTYLTRQLSNLTEASNKIAAGHYGFQVDVVGNDELAQTAKAFNEMSQHVEQAYHKLSQQETFWRQIIDSTLDALIVIDEKGNIESFNDGAQDMLGYSRDEVIGKNIKILVPSPYREQHDGYLQKYKETGETHVIGNVREVEAECKDKSRVPIALHVSELKGMGRLLYVGIMHDLTSSNLAKDKIETSLKEKEILLKEIHHRVKNNLLVVSSLLSMQEDTVDDPDMRDVLTECQSRVHSMAQIHEELYSSTALDRVNVAQYLGQLTHRLLVLYRGDDAGIRIHTEFAPIEINIETATPLGLIVTELVSNSLKHGFSDTETGDIWLSFDFDPDNRECRLCLRDNGKGLPEDFDLKSVDNHMGMQLVDLLSSQLEAKVQYQIKPQTVFELTFVEMHYQKRL